MYAVLDLYGKVTAVSIVSSTLVEDSDSVKAPSLSSDSCSDGDGEDESTPVSQWGKLNTHIVLHHTALFSSLCLLSGPVRERACHGSRGDGLSGESWEKHPAVQSEPDGRSSVKL